MRKQTLKTTQKNHVLNLDDKRTEVKDAKTYAEAMKALHDQFLINVQVLQLVRLK